MGHAEWVKRLIKVKNKAEDLERYLGNNVGNNADWPIKIKVDNEQTANLLSLKLTTLSKALKPFRH